MVNFGKKYLFLKEKTYQDNPKYNIIYSVNQVIIEYFTSKELKELYYEFSKFPSNIENESLYYIEQEIDRRNPVVYTDMRQFDFEMILSSEPFI